METCYYMQLKIGIKTVMLKISGQGDYSLVDIHNNYHPGGFFDLSRHWKDII